MFNRAVKVECLIAELKDGNETFVLSKYPYYYSDGKWYMGAQRYS